MARYGILLLRISLGLVFLWFGFLKFIPGLSPAQDLASRVGAAPDGLVRLSFASKPGVCGRGENISRGGHRDGWDCDEGPVRVALDVRGGQVTAVRTYVGGHWGQAAGRVTDLGTVSAPAAAEYLVQLAEQGFQEGGPHPRRHPRGQRRQLRKNTQNLQNMIFVSVNF